MAKQRMLLHAGRCLMLASVLLCMAPRSFAEYMPHYLMLKVVHTDGVPVSDQQVSIQFQYESGEKRLVAARTDTAGEARFRVAGRTPDSLRIKVYFSERGFRCACRVETTPGTVLRTGVVVAPKTNDSEQSIAARPGQILFVARPSSLVHKILFDDY